jgi:nucleoside-diphosphate-sugar epimerase
VKRVLITGATGFIGRHCLPLLAAQGYDVHAVSSRDPDEKQPGVRWHRANLFDPAEVEKLVAGVAPAHLLHFAWIATPGIYWNSPENLAWVQASLGLLRAFAKHGGRRVVTAGTCAEYDWTREVALCSEQTTRLAPATLYGTSKHALRLLTEAFAREMNMSAAWGRIFFLYGPHEYPERLVASVIRSLLRGEQACSTHGRQVRDLLYVRDVAAAFVALLGSDVNGPVNIASGEGVELREVINKIAVGVDRQGLVQLGTLTAAANEPPVLVADVCRLQDEVGWSPAYTLDQGIEETINWWKLQLSKQ